MSPALPLPTPQHPAAIALDFDGVCKLFTAHKHQIMRTLLFLHLREFQRVPWPEFEEAYRFINFRSPRYAGKERFLCVSALAEHLAAAGRPCCLPGLKAAVETLLKTGKKISAPNLQAFSAHDDVARALAWSTEVNQRVDQLTEIGLTPGIKPHILDAFCETHDFYVVSTASEANLPPLMEKEGVTFIRRYIGQETATKAEALSALTRAGYQAVFMFGDSVEDGRASQAAQGQVPDGVTFFFVPVIPGAEERCFGEGNRIIRAVQEGQAAAARAMSEKLIAEFGGKEVTA
jgi:phosphoglycolate phosphatase-like HAD superfamily hydrolase